MTRRLLNLLTGLSLLLCGAVAALWVRSEFVMDRVVLNSTRNFVEFNGRRGGLWLLWVREPIAGRLWVSLEHERRPPHPVIVRPYTRLHPMGFSLHRSVRGGMKPGVSTWVTAPYWFVMGLAAVPPLVRHSALRKRRGQRSRGLCPACGYDLRATPGRCPECGEASRRGPHAEAAGKGPV